MKGIFISHSTKNGELVEQFVEFLKLGMGIENSRIFCTRECGIIKDIIMKAKEIL